MKLNPTKYAFGVSSGKYLGFMESQRGIEANPEKVKAILKMFSPKTVKEVQKLIRRVVALNRFTYTTAVSAALTKKRIIYNAQYTTSARLSKELRLDTHEWRRSCSP